LVVRRAVLRPVVFFAALLRLDVERARLVPDVDRALLVPDVERDAVDRADVDRLAAVARPPLAPAAFFWAVLPPRLAVERARLVPDVERAREVVVFDAVVRDDVDFFAAVARPPFAPAAFFWAVLPPRLDVERARLVPDVERAREVVDRDDVDFFAAVARPPLAPAAFFWAVLPPRLDADRDELREVPDLARVVPEVDFERAPLVERRGVAALAREIASSVEVSSATDSPMKRSGMRPDVIGWSSRPSSSK
jgi:hypothetical protein